MLRTLVVVGLSALFIVLTVPNIWLPVGSDFETDVDDAFHVRSVNPGSLLDASDVRVGDQVVVSTTDLAVRAAFKNQYLLDEGQTIHFDVLRDGVARRIAITQGAAKPGDYMLGAIKRSSVTLFIIVAATLLLMRPSAMLWGFFLFALGSTHGTPLILKWVSYPAGAIGGAIANPIYDVLGTVGLLMFATKFPTESKSGVRRTIERWTPAIGAAVIAAQIPLALFLSGVALPPGTSAVTDVIPVAAYAIGIIALLTGFLQADAAQRQRLRWVVAGFGVYWAVVLWLKIALYLPHQAWPVAWSNAGLSFDALNGLVIFIPITVAYAVLKHHVLDLNFVIGRGLVYAILTSIAVAVFAILEWLVGGVLAQTRLATAGEVVAAIAIGFWLNSLHGSIDRFVDSVIFRKRHFAEKRLAQVAAGLPHADSEIAVSRLLVNEPVEALGLLSASFFRRGSARSGYGCELEAGIPAYRGALIGQDDVLAVHLHGARGPVFLHHIGWTLNGDIAANAPVVAFPLFVRHELDGIVLYGGHETGEAIDPDEIRAISALCTGAAAALDHIEAVELRRRLAETERTVLDLRAALQP